MLGSFAAVLAWDVRLVQVAPVFGVPGSFELVLTTDRSRMPVFRGSERECRNRCRRVVSALREPGAML